MDRYEYNEKLTKINELVSKKEYKEAANIADMIDWKRVRNLRTLCMVSEIYAENERLEDSKDILLKAYKRQPNSQMILRYLINICIDRKAFDEAEEFYEEYVQYVSNDEERDFWRDKIDRGREASISNQIPSREVNKKKNLTSLGSEQQQDPYESFCPICHTRQTKNICEECGWDFTMDCLKYGTLSEIEREGYEKKIMIMRRQYKRALSFQGEKFK